MKISLKEAAQELHLNNDFHILTHKNPDGDTLGCAFGLWNILNAMGKRASVFCSDEFPDRYDFLYEGYISSAKEQGYVVSVDVADTKLLGKLAEKYDKSIDLCIDHHITNEFYAKKTFVDAKAAAACELVYLIGKEAGFSIDMMSARCLYTGISTDSGCFRYSNTTPRTHIIAADLLGYGFDFSWVNRRMFEIKTKGRILLESYLIKNIEYFAGGRSALISFPESLISSSQIKDTDFDGISSMPLQSEGVEVAITIREKASGLSKVSMRSPNKVNVSAICGLFGGGGHVNAAGCEMHGELDDIKKRIISTIENVLSSNV